MEEDSVEDIDCDAFVGNTGVGPEIPELLPTELAPTSVLVEVEVPGDGVGWDEICEVEDGNRGGTIGWLTKYFL